MLPRLSFLFRRDNKGVRQTSLLEVVVWSFIDTAVDQGQKSPNQTKGGVHIAVTFGKITLPGMRRGCGYYMNVVQHYLGQNIEDLAEALVSVALGPAFQTPRLLRKTDANLTGKEVIVIRARLHVFMNPRCFPSFTCDLWLFANLYRFGKSSESKLHQLKNHIFASLNRAQQCQTPIKIVTNIGC